MRQFLKIFLPILALSACNALVAADTELTADDFYYDAGAHTRKAVGNAIFINADITLEADQISFDEQSHVVHAMGNVRVTRRNLRLVTEDIFYSLDDKTFRCTKFRAGFPPMFFEGDSAYGNKDKVDLVNARAYFGEPEWSSPSMAAEHMTLNPGKRLLAVGAKPGIGKSSLLRIPHISGSPQKFPKVYTSVDLGYQSSLGGFASARVEVPVNTWLSAGGNIDLYSKRGVLFGPSASYNYENSATSLSGSVNTGFIHDTGTSYRNYDYFANAVPSDRWFVQERHIQTIQDTVSVTSCMNLMSDPMMMRDFRHKYYVTDEYPDNYFEVSSPIGQDVVVSLLARYATRGVDYATIQRLPEIRIDYLTNPLPFAGLYQTGYVMAVNTDYTVDGDHYYNSRAHMYYGLQRPFDLGPWLNFTPKVGGFLGHYDKTWNIDGDNITEAGEATHYIGELGADLSASFYSQWDYKNAAWDIDGLRHVVRPVVYWRHYGTAGDNKQASIDIDSDAYPVQMPSIDLRDMETNDLYYLYKPELVRSGIENVLQTRDGEGSRDLASLNLYHDSYLTGNDKNCNFVQTSLSPLKWLDLGLEDGFYTDPVTSAWYRGRVTLKSGELWRVNFYADYYSKNFEQYTVNYFYQVARNWGVGPSVSYDAVEDDINSVSLSVMERLGDFWKIRYRIARTKNDLRDDNVTFSITVAGERF